MRILLINDNYERVGGAEGHFFSLIDALRARGHEVFAFGCSTERFGVEGNDFIYKESPWRLVRYISRITFNPIVYSLLRAWIKRVRPDVIHLHNINKHTLAILAALRGKRVVWTAHDWNLICPVMWCVYRDELTPCAGGMGLKCLRHRCLSPLHYISYYIFYKLRHGMMRRMVDRILAPSPQLAGQLSDNGFSPVMHLPYFYDGPLEKTGRRTGKRVLYLGQLAANKGVGLLPEIMKLVIDKLPKAVMDIVGSGSELDRLKKTVKEQGLSRSIRLHGRKHKRAIQVFLRKASLMVVPSIWMENSPFSVIEAMASGLPVVGSDRGGIPWLVGDEKTGYIVKACDAQRFSERIVVLLKDRDLAESMGEAARQRVSELFEREVILDRLEGVYRKRH